MIDRLEIEAPQVRPAHLGDRRFEGAPAADRAGAESYLAARQLPISRLFLGPPKTAAADDKWTLRADLQLTTE